MVFLGSPRFFSPLFSSTLDLTRWELATLRWREHSVRLEPCKSGIYYSHVSQTVNGSSKHQKARSPEWESRANSPLLFRASRFRFEERVTEVDRAPPKRYLLTFSPIIPRTNYASFRGKWPPYREGGTVRTISNLLLIVVMRRCAQTRVFARCTK